MSKPWSSIKHKKKCTIPPPGWRCTRDGGHDGPCAAVATAHVTKGDVRKCIDGDHSNCTEEVVPLVRYRFVKDDDGHTYLIPADKKEAFDKWLAAGPYWEDYVGEEFDYAGIDSATFYTFLDPRED